jgi:sortase A
VPRALVGYALLVIGGATVVYAGGRYAVGNLARQEARRAWEESEARAIVALARQASVLDQGTAAPLVPGAPVARLLIPRLKLDEIVLEGVDDNALNAGPGHLPGSAFPGENGNAIISAHRDRHFAKLRDIRIGDTVITESGARLERWIVVARRVIDADAPALYRTTDATLTLTTCWPIRYFGTAPDRLIVTAKRIERGRQAETPSFAAGATS